MASYILYHYDPSIAGAVIFIFLFFVMALLHTIQLVRYRAWFMIPVIVGGISYIGRVVSHHNSQAKGPFITSSILALVAPALFAASIYMILGRIIRLLRAEHHSLIKVDRLTMIFVLCDIVSFIVQSGGGGMQVSKTHGLVHTGQVLVIAALFLQMIIFGLFIMVAAIFHRRLKAQPTQSSLSSLPWQKHMLGLYLASGLILVRNTVRTIEYIQGYSGYINSHEVFLYVFDAVPMFLVMVVMAVIYAPKIIKEEKERELSDSAIEMQGRHSKHGIV
ncbi:hypothetical protein P7C71_g5076, partial [Lecanoromycetidae sp. Uapishka_2]